MTEKIKKPKKPRRYGADKLNFGRNLGYEAGVEDGRVYGRNNAITEYSAYHLWTRKQRLSVEEIVRKLQNLKINYTV